MFLQADTWLKREDTRHKQGEFYILTLSTLLGMYFMVSAGHFLLFFLGLELATVPMACLVAFDKYKGHSAEAGAKFILSALFSSGIFLYGISMIYGTAGTLYFEDIPAGLTGTPLQVLALVFFFSGLAFKLSLVPFHLWTADTYQGAPTTVSAYLSVISKGAAAFALMIILMKVFGPMTEQWSEILCIIIVSHHHYSQSVRHPPKQPETLYGLQQYFTSRLHNVGCTGWNSAGHGIPSILYQ